VKERKTEITVETYEVLAISHRGPISRSWCAGCGRQVTVICSNDASLSGLSEEAIGQLAQDGRLHLIEAGGRPSLICLNSLIQSWKGELQCKTGT
jgi:hypothetical protein